MTSKNPLLSSEVQQTTVQFIPQRTHLSAAVYNKLPCSFETAVQLWPQRTNLSAERYNKRPCRFCPKTSIFQRWGTINCTAVLFWLKEPILWAVRNNKRPSIFGPKEAICQRRGNPRLGALSRRASGPGGRDSGARGSKGGATGRSRPDPLLDLTVLTLRHQGRWLEIWQLWHFAASCYILQLLHTIRSTYNNFSLEGIAIWINLFRLFDNLEQSGWYIFVDYVQTTSWTFYICRKIRLSSVKVAKTLSELLMGV